MRRAVVIVLDGCGAGAAPDAEAFGDPGLPSTLLHVHEAAGPIRAPMLHACGFLAAGGVPPSPRLEGDGCVPDASLDRFGVRYGRLRPRGMGKDSVTGHWEMMGAVVEKPFPTYPNGFPIQLVKEFERAIGSQTLGNRAASGTQIIAELGQQHLDTGFPILYTSADSVFQVAAHEEVVPIERLYEICRIGRELCVAPNDVQRVIARPFVGDAAGGFRRTERRKDFPLSAPPNLADRLGDVFGIGVVPELFAGRGFRAVRRTQSNPQHEEMLLEALDSDARFAFANFEDFDMLYGHRNDPEGFARCLERFDGTLRKVVERLRSDDLLLLTADHGNDPTDASTDHSREYVPVCVVASGLSSGPIGDVDGICAVGATVARHLGVDWEVGTALQDRSIKSAT